MSDGRYELGFDEPGSAPKDMPPRRRLFEGGSGVVPSSFQHNSHQTARDFQIETCSVRQQSASLSSRAVLEELNENNNENHGGNESSRIDEEDEDEFVEPIHSRAQQTSGAEFQAYSDSPDVSMSELIPTASPSPSGFTRVDPEPEEQEQPLNGRKILSYLPSVAVGTLLNILDGLSYGMILMPLSLAAFENTEAMGLSLFYVSTIISQLVFSLGGSGFKACIGSEMIEIVPFFHALAFTIAGKLPDASREEILATTITAFAVSCVLTGLTFFLLGWLRLGTLVGFFPMHILLGCIGGVGWFLVATGFEVSARIEGGIEYNFETLQLLFRNWEVVIQWGGCLALGCLLMFAERRLHHPLVVPTILVATFGLFHLTVALIPQFTLDAARERGWVFPAQSTSSQPWWYFYTLYKPSLIHLGPILQCFPVMLALTFFGLIHVPINIPALAAATKEDSINVNRELIAHGLSNTLSGLMGSIQNYLVYTNSVMFVKSGADGPVAGIMLAIATAAVMVAGPGIIGFIPVMVVASLIFMMGLDLMAEALVDTYGKVRKQDYITMVLITLTMGCYDFVVGILAGIVLACLFFVITSARRSPVQATMTGAQAHSTVIRHPVLQTYLDTVGKQVYIMRLAGALFFGTNGRLEKEVRGLSEDSVTSFKTIRFLVIDLENVTDIDYCTVDTFLKLKRLLDASEIRLILSGAETAGHKIRGLKAVDLVPDVVDHDDPLSVRVFATLNIALSWCENQFIKEYFQQRTRFRKRGSLATPRTPGRLTQPVRSGAAPINMTEGLSHYGLEGSPNPHTAFFGTTPRSSFIRTEAKQAAHEDVAKINKWNRHQQPLLLVMQIVDSISSKGVDFWEKIVPFLTPQTIRSGDKLPSGFHFVESGGFHIQFPSGFYESAVAGTVLGELPEKKSQKAVIRAETEARVWTLKPLGEIRSAPDGMELTLELLTVYLVTISERYQRMTDYYRIAD